MVWEVGIYDPLSHSNSSSMVVCSFPSPSVSSSYRVNIAHRSYEKAKTDLGNALAKLNAHLAEHKYLAATTTKISLADIVVASTLLYPFKLVCDPNYLQPYPHVVRWFQACVGAPEFQQVVGTVTLCQKELKAAAAPET